MLIRLKGGLEMVTVTAYGPQVGCEEKEKETFLMDLEGLIKEVSEDEKLVIGDDLHGHVGRESNGYDGVHGDHGHGLRNEDLVQRQELLVCNTRYRKRDKHLIAYSSGGRCRQLDYITVKQREAKSLKDCKVIPGSDIVSQHKLVVLDIRRKEEPERKVKKIGRFRTWKLKNVEMKCEFSKAVEKLNTGWEREGDAEGMRQKLKKTLRPLSTLRPFFRYF